MKRQEADYEEDVFSLDEDLAHERKKQLISYFVVSACAVALVALSLYGAVTLTRQRIEDQKHRADLVKTVVVADPEQPPVLAKDTNFWPASAFPEVPPMDAPAYDTETSDGHAVINLPAAASDGFAAYLTALTEKGAALYVQTSKLSVADLNGVEIHLIASNLKTQIVLCDEPAFTFSESGYQAFPLPESGKLVTVAPGVGANSRILTYRNASVTDALAYTGALAQAGWTLNGTLEPDNQVFQAVYKKNNLQIAVDYFTSGDAYQVRLDFLT